MKVSDVQESLEQEPPIDPRILETLELQKQQLEMLIANTRQGASLFFLLQFFRS